MSSRTLTTLFALSLFACSSPASSSSGSETSHVDPQPPPAVSAHAGRIARGVLQDEGKDWPTLDILFSTSSTLCSDTPAGAGDTTIGVTFTGTGEDLARGTYALAWPPRAGQFAGWMHHVGDDCHLDGPGAAALSDSTAEILSIGPDEVTVKVHLVTYYGTMDGTYTARSCAVAEPLEGIESCKPSR